MVYLADILILSNGPGEILTWVRPVVRQIQQQLQARRSQIRISLVLSPCPHATGKEAEIARGYPEIDRVQSAASFGAFLLWGKTEEHWDWCDRGVVLFLGGDQFFAAIVGKRLQYRTVVYAEWESRWHGWIDCFAARTPDIVANAPKKYARKFEIVGDLMRDISVEKVRSVGENRTPLIGFLPGSKAAKLTQGVPFCLAIAHHLRARKPNVRFAIPVAPTVDLSALERFADAQQNPIATKFEGATGRIVRTNEFPKLVSAGGVEIDLWTRSPAYDRLVECDLCVTTVGANTAELGSLGIPAIVLVPTQQLDAMRAWDGLPGLLANLPGVGSVFAKLINWMVLKQKRLFAWPNIWAGEEIVPEISGVLNPADIARRIADLLDCPEDLKKMRDRLQKLRGESGAAEKVARIVLSELTRLENQESKS